MGVAKSGAAVRFGIDLGGTKVEIMALDPAGNEIYRRRAATPARDYAATVAAVADLVRQAESDLGATGTVGIGTPGAVSKATERMKNCNSTCLNGQPLPADLEAALSRPVR
ncbi:ROK family protein, partial [Methylogaea oryzae]